jgi:hypothetical protein
MARFAMEWWVSMIGAGLGTAIVQGAFAIFRDYYLRKSRAAYMAMRLAVTLEAYSAACWDIIQRIEFKNLTLRGGL